MGRAAGQDPGGSRRAGGARRAAGRPVERSCLSRRAGFVKGLTGKRPVSDGSRSGGRTPHGAWPSRGRKADFVIGAWLLAMLAHAHGLRRVPAIVCCSVVYLTQCASSSVRTPKKKKNLGWKKKKKKKKKKK